VQGELKIVANIPYHLTTPIFDWMIEGINNLKSATLIVQYEIGEKLLTLESFFSIKANSYFTPTLIASLPKEAFSPAPNVRSAIIHLKKKEKPLHSPPFLLFAKKLISMKRKTLQHQFKHLGYKTDHRLLREHCRLSSLSIEELFTLYAACIAS